MADINGDGKAEFILQNANGLAVALANGTNMFESNFTCETLIRPAIGKINGKTIVIAVNPCNEEIMLMNNEGETLDNSPLLGSSKFVVGDLNNTKEGINNIYICDSTGRLYAYLLFN